VWRSFQPTDATADARRLLDAFLKRAYRHAVPVGEVDRFLKLTQKAMTAGFSFTEAMLLDVFGDSVFTGVCDARREAGEAG
jgi:hypothetical protein